MNHFYVYWEATDKYNNMVDNGNGYFQANGQVNGNNFEEYCSYLLNEVKTHAPHAFRVVLKSVTKL